MKRLEKVLVVDDEELMRIALVEVLQAWGYATAQAEDIRSALAAFETDHPSVVLLDVNLPDGSGLDLLRTIKQRWPETLAIVITANVMLDNTLSALRGGAYDFIRKPVDIPELRVTIQNGLEALRLRTEIGRMRATHTSRYGFDRIIGESPAMREVVAFARKVAANDEAAVLLQGESGTGKELFAKAIHYASERHEGPLVAINCAAIPSELLESELFGYEKGAFTDARGRKEGLFEQAHAGTLFLDEIGDLLPPLQAKLLRVLEDGTFRRVGGVKTLSLDARVIAASNRDLRAETTAGRFRQDLFYRLAVIQIRIPPLRERGDDVVLLAQHYIRRFSNGERKACVLSPEAEAALQTYSWPGNVRELRNAIERALILEEDEVITTKYLAIATADEVATRAASREGPFVVSLPPGGISLEEIENSLIRQALDRASGNQTRAARLLGLSRDQLRYRVKRIAEQNGREPHH